MAKIYIIMGKSATGKDTVFKKVMDRIGTSVSNIVTYTTRPARVGETDGVDYHFATDSQVEEYRKAGRIIECRTYQTALGPWHYFTLDDGQIDLNSDRKYLIINTLEAYEQYVKYFGQEIVVPIYIEISQKERIHRALDREDRQDTPQYMEMCRRFLADEEDFKEEKLIADGIRSGDRFSNTELATCVDAVTKRILQ